jgi:hypothetical protein
MRPLPLRGDLRELPFAPHLGSEAAPTPVSPSGDLVVAGVERPT